MLQRLLKTVALAPTVLTFEDSLNEIRQIIYYLHRAKE